MSVQSIPLFYWSEMKFIFKKKENYVVEFSNKLFGDGVKFIDYLESVGIRINKPVLLKEKKTKKELLEVTENFHSLPENNVVDEFQKGLMKASPF